MKYEYWLYHLEGAGIGSARRRLLREYFGSARELYRQNDSLLKKLPKILPMISQKQADALSESRRGWDLEEYSRLEEKGIFFVTEACGEFPGKLKEIAGGPDGLFYKGKLPREDMPSVAVVGARKASDYGMETARWFAGELARQGVQVISGLAFGIDGWAHQGALDADGSTFGVLGSGVDVCYPAAHIQLYQLIQRKGGLLSEYVPGTKPLPGHFPRRNRIISGLCDAVLVVEAREKSGSLITADLALEQGRDVYAVPGRVSDPNSRGCNRLIAQGAGIALSPDELMKELGILCRNNANFCTIEKISLAPEEELVYSCLDSMPKGLEEILQKTELTVSQVLSALLSLQLKGCVTETEKAHYRLNSRFLS